MRLPRSTLVLLTRCLAESSENDIHRTKMQTLFFRARFFSASRMRQTRVENLSQSDMTNLSKSMFMNNTNLVTCQSPHVLPSLGYFSRLCCRSILLNFFGLEVISFFFLLKHSRWAPITFDTLRSNTNFWKSECQECWRQHCQIHRSRKSYFFRSSHQEKRLTVSKPGRSQKCALGGPATSQHLAG